MSLKKRLVVCSVGAVLGLVTIMFPGELKTSRKGQEHIAKWEQCVRCTYQDSVGVLTNGLGATRDVDGKKFSDNRTLTDGEVAQLFVRDLKVNEQCVISRMNGNNMPQSVFDASVSLVHNVGCAGTTWNSKTQKKTAIRVYAEKGNWTAVCDAMMQFTFAGGKRLQGLINRRDGDRKLCLEDIN